MVLDRQRLVAVLVHLSDDHEVASGHCYLEAVSMEQPTPPSPASTPPRTGSHSVFSLRDDERQKAPSLTIAKEGAGSEIDLESREERALRHISKIVRQR
jgi:hypothetical protein